MFDQQLQDGLEVEECWVETFGFAQVFHWLAEAHNVSDISLSRRPSPLRMLGSAQNLIVTQILQDMVSGPAFFKHFHFFTGVTYI